MYYFTVRTKITANKETLFLLVSQIKNILIWVTVPEIVSRPVRGELSFYVYHLRISLIKLSVYTQHFSSYYLYFFSFEQAQNQLPA